MTPRAPRHGQQKRALGIRHPHQPTQATPLYSFCHNKTKVSVTKLRLSFTPLPTVSMPFDEIFVAVML